MLALLSFLLTLLTSPFRSKSRLAAENAALRHQVVVLRRKARGRIHLTNADRLFFVQLYRWFPSILKATSGPRRSFVGIELAFAATGVGNPAPAEAGHPLTRTCGL